MQKVALCNQNIRNVQWILSRSSAKIGRLHCEKILANNRLKHRAECEASRPREETLIGSFAKICRL